MKKLVLAVLAAPAFLLQAWASPVQAQSLVDPQSVEELAKVDPLSSEEAWQDATTTDVALLKRKEIAPGIFPTREEMRSLALYGCFVGGDVIGSDPKIARMMAAGLQCTDDFRKEVNKRKAAGSTTIYVHESMIGYMIRIEKRGSKEQGNSTCDAVSPFGSVDPIGFACFNDMSGHQRVMGFATALGQIGAQGVVNYGLMRAQRPNQTVIDNRSGSQSGSSSDAEVETTGGGNGPIYIDISAIGNNAPITTQAGANAEVTTPGCGTAPCR